MASSAAETAPSFLRTSFPLAKLGLFSVLLLALYAPVLYAMAEEWFTQDEMGHGIFVPFVAAYVAWKQRDDIARQPVRPTWWGVLLLVWGFCQLLIGYLGADFFIARIAFFISLIGVILATCGTAVLKSLFFPLVLLLFMVRLPLFIYSQITFPLQLFASQVAEFGLQLIGIPVMREGNILELAQQRLSVVEACSGIRSLISLSFLALVYAYMFDNKVWMRWFLLAAAIPIAIAANAARVTITGIISEYKAEFAQGAYHTMEGWVIFIFAIVMMVTVHQTVNRIYGFVHARN